MKIKITKLQGLGNDFIIINNKEYNFSEEEISKIAKRLCARRVSVGADGLIMVDEAESNADFKMKFYNADGSIGEMCGNGARCIARYAYINNIAEKEMKFETKAGIVSAKIKDNRMITVKLNNPETIDMNKKIFVNGEEYSCTYVELGNPGLPHAVVEYSGLSKADQNKLFKLGKHIRNSEKFPKGANVNFYEIEDNNKVIVKTYERGVENFTLACGTGAASTAITLILKDIIHNNNVKIIVPGGELYIEVEQRNKEIDNVYLTGSTNIIFEGVIIDEDLKI